LRPEHIKRFSRGDEREAYITLQWIKKPENFDPKKLEIVGVLQNAGMVPPPDVAFLALQNVDALFGGIGVRLPSTVILDYIYGITAYKAWRSKRDDGFDQMKAYHNEHYAQILPPPSSPDDDTGVTSGPDDPNDPDYKPLQPRKRYTPTRRSGLEEAMDELNMFLNVYPWNHARNGCRAQSERNRAGGAGSSGSEPKQSDGVEESSGRPLKCIHNCCLPIVLCAHCLLYCIIIVR
jgi:hypothetical protein